MDSFNSIPEFLARRAHSDDEAICVLAERSLSYRMLAEAVAEVGQVLARSGLTCSDRVALALPTSACAAVALLGVASFAVAAPLNPAYRDREFRFFLSDLSAKAIILPEGGGGAARAVALEMGLLILELRPRSDWGAGRFELRSSAQSCFGAQPRASGSADIALVLHTSGTTGRSKIVPLSHGRLCITANNIRYALQLGPKDRCLQCMPLFHVHGILNALLSTLAAGGTTLCMPGFDPHTFCEWYAQLRPTWYTAVPTIHQSVLSIAEAQRLSADAAQLRFVRSSSAPLAPSVAARLEAFFRAPVIESYGMTEVDQIATNPLPPRVRKSGSVGLPGGPQVLVMDENAGPLPAGQVGEVAVRGPNVIDGYEGGSAVNGDSFINGYFRTGDLGYFDTDGYLFLVGRKKEIINRAGQKIAPRDVDEVLLEHPAVEEAAAFGVADDLLGEDLEAAVVLREGSAVSAGELRAYAAARIADFKVPSNIHVVEALPKGPTGKLRRADLSQRFGALRKVISE